MKKYNKLVRDLIPEVIEADWKKCETEIVYGEEKTKFLEDKLKEEVDEYLEDKNLEELADVMEVLFGLAHNLGYSEEDLLNGMTKWPDNKPSDWYYINVQEATNSHNFERKGEINEKWTAITANPDWYQYKH